MNDQDNLRLTMVASDPAGSLNPLTWTSKPTQQYHMLQSTNLLSNYTTNLTLGLVVPDPGTNTMRTVSDAATTNRFFKVEAVRPLGPERPVEKQEPTT